jgi:signal transduction histidine kinase
MSYPALKSSPRLVIVGNNAELTARASEAARLALPGAKIESAATVADATTLPSSPSEVGLVLVAPAETEIATAVSTLDEEGLPRWAVVIFGDGAVTRTDGVGVLPADGKMPATLEIFRLALALHQLRRENARFRGDLSTLGTRVVHDLRSPLGGVLTSVEVLKEVLAEEAPERVSLLDPILDSTEGLTKLIRQLGVITKASSQTNPKQRFNMAGPFWAAFQRVEQEALSLGASIAQPASWPEVEGDPAWAEVMWHAFLCNSLQHAGPKPRIEAGWDRGQGENRFWLVDPGTVPLEKRGALFRPFHLLHHPSAPRGFGLPIVQRLAELQGGHSGYESQPEGRSCFFFTLPEGKSV